MEVFDPRGKILVVADGQGPIVLCLVLDSATHHPVVTMAIRMVNRDC